MKQIYSPWWLENIFATPLSIVPIYCVLMLLLMSFLSIGQCFSFLGINFILAIFINNIASFNKSYCEESIKIFQFNIKYQENETELTSLVDHLISQRYHLIALQGVSQRSKHQLITMLSPYFPHFINGANTRAQVISDQLLFSHYAFTDINYVGNGHSAFLISSQWHLPLYEINLHSLHPPSPRNEQFWQTRNKTLYQLKYALNQDIQAKSADTNLPKEQLRKAEGLVTMSLVIGDLNLSKHSSRIKPLKASMKSKPVNSWPNKPYIPTLFGLAIDQLWISEQADICQRKRVHQFSWSDHYALATKLSFKTPESFKK